MRNKKAVRLLAKRSLKAGRQRNIIAVAAIALTSVLFTTLFTVGSGMIENTQRQTMRQAGGDGMGVLKYITDEEYDAMKDHELIEEISYNRVLSESVENPELLKRHGELYYMDDTGIRLGFCEPSGGHKPVAADEIMLDTTAMQLLGVKEKEGEPVTLTLMVHGKEVTRDFVLSGWWEADPVFNVSIMVTSRAYVDQHIGELYNSYKEDSCLTGVINSYVMFRNSLDLEGKVEQVITDSGYSVREEDADFIAHNVNWAYMSTNFDLSGGTIAAVLAALLLIIFAGYLIIYNIFQISVVKDIRFYGLLKTIGTTGKQIKGIIRRQALLLACIGIPAGLVLGYLIGIVLVPVIMDNSFYAAVDYETSVNPLIFIGSLIFTAVTLLISISRPGRIAAKVSPVEAVRYTDVSVKTGRVRKTEKGAGLAAMAAANLGRNKRRTVLVLLSMSLSLVLFNTVYTFSIGFDMDKYLAKFIETDYLIAHADFFNYEYAGPENSLSESMIAAVEERPGFEEGGRIYANIRDTEYFSVETDGAQGETLEPVDADGNAFSSVYGLEELPLQNLTVLEGEIDEEKLKTGDYILEGILLDDHDRPMWETSHYDVGGTVVLHNHKGAGETAAENEFMTYEFEVMAKVGVKNYTNSCGVGYDYNFYLPAQVYCGMVETPGVMNYLYNVAAEEEPLMDAFLKNYTDTVEPVMSYSSKTTRVKEFEGMRNMFLVVGGALSLILGMIGILNFVNSVLTSILTRRREFAMLQSIGMTTSQLRRMLVLEGLYYTAGAGALSLLLGSALNILIAEGIAENLWFFTYHFTLLALICVLPVLLFFGTAVPAAVLRTVERQSVVDRLRMDE